MRRARQAFYSLVVSLAATAGAARGQTAPAAAGQGAAESYREAIRLAQGIDDPVDLRLLDTYETAPLGESVQRFLERHGDILRLVHEGAKQKSCDWGDVPIAEVLPLLNGTRRVASISVLQGRWDTKQGKPADAAGHHLDAIAMARHIDQRRILIAKLVAASIETLSIRQIGAELPSYPAELLGELPNRLDALPAGATAKELMDGERTLSRAQIAEQGAMAKVVFEAMEPMYDDLAKALEAPPAEFAGAMDEIEKKYGENMLAKTVIPSLRRTRDTLTALDAQRAMLRTAIDVQSNGEGAVAKSKDPPGTARSNMPSAGTDLR